MIAQAELRVTDLKQYAYCPRIPFYQHVMGFDGKPTRKMARGREAQAAIEALEQRRTLREYGAKRKRNSAQLHELSEGRRHFAPWLTSHELGLAGKLDLLIETDAACFPVDFKYTSCRPHRNHQLQLAGYALLVEEAFCKPVPAGFIFLTLNDEIVGIPMTPVLMSEARSALRELAMMIEHEQFPEPTPIRNRCTDCEYRNFCGDVF